ncbi:MAG: cytochrome c [Actinobacteria bacterium]|nr:cytochrome c [Actinomycetota bacterium]MCI0544774.1 cytochrome c [Actinomycetota bacterium]MCI0678146.1 cytochrome c [Actinomycetota bacterium]
MKVVVGAVVTTVLTIASVAVLLVGPGEATGAETPRSDGRLLFQATGCVACHTLGDMSRGTIGPDLNGLAGRAASRVPGLDGEAYVRQSLRAPQAFLVPGYGDAMPTFDLTDEELDALIEFLMSG